MNNIKFKKIIFYILLICSIFTFSSCSKNDEAICYEILKMPRDVEYGILTKNSYVSYGNFYNFSSEIKEALKKEHNYSSKNPDINDCVLINDKMYLVAKYQNNLFLKRKYVFGYFDLEKKDFTILYTFKSIDQNIELYRTDNHIVLLSDDYYHIFDSKNDNLTLTIELKKKWVKKVQNNHFVYLNEDGFVIYDSQLNCYKVPANVNLEDYENEIDYYIRVYQDHILYFDQDHNRIFINYKTFEVKDYSEFLADLNKIPSPLPKFNMSEYRISKDEIKIAYDGISYVFKLQELKDNHKIISDVEKLCNTEVKFTSLFMDKEEIFVSIGNDSSFFSCYTSGTTIPLIFRFNRDNNTFSYVGSSGQKSEGWIRMIPLE